MAKQRKYAILDTDFVSKANIIKSGNHMLADEVVAFPKYSFFCHQKMKKAWGVHGTRNAQVWLESKIALGEIICYSDDQILFEMSEYILRYCFSYYRTFLKQGCELFDSEFYGQYFHPLDELMEMDGYNSKTFLTVLRSCEIKLVIKRIMVR